MTNVMTNEVLKEEQLDEVAGGSYSETMELIRAIGLVDIREKRYSRRGSRYETVRRQLEGGEVREYLKDHYGIDSIINFRAHSFLYDGQKNTYKKDGKSLTHYQVWDMIVEKI